MNRIKEIPFFSHLAEEDIKKLKNISVIKKYNQKEILFYEGDEPKYLHILLDGVLRLYKINHKGTQIFLHQFLPVSLVAELANFEQIPYPATAEFTSRGEVLKIDYQKLEESFFKNPELSLKIIKSLAGKLKIMSEVITNEIVLTAEAKIAKFLVENTELFDTLKNTQIASLLNLTPETLSRTLTKFKNKDLILIDEQNKVEILNIDTLLSMYAN
ncbi:Crp/Fnr family transcriptional regulator [Sulfurospirillum arcachonense]|uniref:Crp/Fnr family transcriptional regulator n=1 Tax=Sulfurospirillum arcachonense TaxID=57666 RepID=UPI0004684E2E|nr:Crp/Fnr family transcriptional regulator [Sulfurospirillum arcachonense]